MRCGLLPISSNSTALDHSIGDLFFRLHHWHRTLVRCWRHEGSQSFWDHRHGGIGDDCLFHCRAGSAASAPPTGSLRTSRHLLREGLLEGVPRQTGRTSKRERRRLARATVGRSVLRSARRPLGEMANVGNGNNVVLSFGNTDFRPLRRCERIAGTNRG